MFAPRGVSKSADVPVCYATPLERISHEFEDHFSGCHWIGGDCCRIQREFSARRQERPQVGRDCAENRGADHESVRAGTATLSQRTSQKETRSLIAPVSGKTANLSLCRKPKIPTTARIAHQCAKFSSWPTVSPSCPRAPSNAWLRSAKPTGRRSESMWLGIDQDRVFGARTPSRTTWEPH